MGLPADVNVRDNLGDTPLHHAIQNDQVDALNLLIANGADTSVVNNRQMAAIHCAVELNKPTVLQVSGQ